MITAEILGRSRNTEILSKLIRGGGPLSQKGWEPLR